MSMADLNSNAQSLIKNMQMQFRHWDALCSDSALGAPEPSWFSGPAWTLQLFSLTYLQPKVSQSASGRQTAGPGSQDQHVTLKDKEHVG